MHLKALERKMSHIYSKKVKWQIATELYPDFETKPEFHPHPTVQELELSHLTSTASSFSQSR